MVPGRAGLVLDDHRLAELLLHRLRLDWRTMPPPPGSNDTMAWVGLAG
jgi:hypothetical protein